MFEDSKVVDPAVLFPALVAAIGAVPVRPDPATPAAVVRAEARALVAAGRAVQALLLGRLAVIDGQGLAEGDGFGSSTAWVAGYTNQDRPGARALIKAARVADRLPALGQLLAAGKIGPEHLSALASGAKRVPDEVLAEHEFTLTNLAPHARPSDMRRVGEKIRTVHDHDATEADAGYLRESRYLSLVRTFQGGWDLQGALDPEAGASVQVVLDALAVKKGPEDSRTAAQRRADAFVEAVQLGMRSGMLPDVAGDRPRVTFLVRTDTADSTGGAGADAGEGGDAAGADAGSVAGTLRLDAALAGLVHRMLHHVGGAVTGDGAGAPLAGSRRPVTPPADGCSCHGDTAIPAQRSGADGDGTQTPATAPASLPVTVFGGQHLISGCEDPLGTATVERVCCNALLNVTLVDRWDNPLYQGRDSRSHSPTQARAVITRDRHCVFPGCDTPPARCQIHHLIFWSHDGKTDIENLALVCWFHHHLIHEGHWTLHRAPATLADDSTGGADLPPTWVATDPNGRQLRQHRQPAA